MTDWQWYFSSDYRREGLLRDRLPVLTAVREQLLAAEPGSTQRTVLFRWLKPQVLAAAEAIARTPGGDRPISCDVSTPGGTITVTPDGPDSTRMGVVLAELATEDPTLRTQLIGGVAATAGLAVIAIVLALTGRTGLAVSC